MRKEEYESRMASCQSAETDSVFSCICDMDKDHEPPHRCHLHAHTWMKGVLIQCHVCCPPGVPCPCDKFGAGPEPAPCVCGHTGETA